MPNLDNHMDELFQKAAENYPLKTGQGNFDDLMPFIAGETASTATAIPSKGKRKTAILLLAFLVITGTISTYLINNNNKNKALSEKADLKKQIDNLTQSGSTKHVIIDDPVGDDETVAESKKLNEEFFEKTNAGASYKAKLLIKISGSFAVTDNSDIETDPAGTAAETKTAISKTDLRDLKNVDLISEVKKQTKEKPVYETASSNDQTSAVDKNNKKKKNKPGFYYGIAAGTELNQVKNQGMTKIGFNAGVLVGLQINKKISVETGVQLSQKKYYTSGEYFNPKTGSMPSNMKIMSLKGTSTMIEIPVSVKYNFTKNENTFYGKAGVSSYLVTKEKNNYKAMVSGQEQEINSTYNNNKFYSAAEIRLGAGYEKKLNKKLNIRVEPYIQIPLKGIGIGALPVTSTGLQLVLIHN